MRAAESGTDYVGSGARLTFEAGTTVLTRTLSVPVRGDNFYEAFVSTY